MSVQARDLRGRQVSGTRGLPSQITGLNFSLFLLYFFVNFLFYSVW